MMVQYSAESIQLLVMFAVILFFRLFRISDECLSAWDMQRDGDNVGGTR